MAPRRVALFGHYLYALEVGRYLDPAGYSLTVMDDDEDNLRRARDRGFATRRVDYRDDAELRQAGIGTEIDVLYAFLADDARNVYLVISARSLDPRLTIIAIADSANATPKLLAAGANKVISTHEISARRVWGVLKQPLLIDILDNAVFGAGNLRMAEVPVPAGSFMDGAHIWELRLPERYHLIPIGVVDRELQEDLLFTTRGYNHRLDAGDMLVVIGVQAEIDRLKSELAGAAGSPRPATPHPTGG